MTIRHLLPVGILFCSIAVCRTQEVHITFKVADDFGKPVPGATVTMATFERWKPGEAFGEDIYKRTSAITDADGRATVKGTSTRPVVKYGVSPLAGYYYSGSGEITFKESKDGRWHPWNPTVELVLKPVLAPVAAYQKHVELAMPQKGVRVGYDLMAGDWVRPYGKGTHSDFVFGLERKPDRTVKSDGPYSRDVKLFDAAVTLTFSKESDGIQSVLSDPNDGGELRLPRNAPEEGYEPQLVKRTYRESAGKTIATGTKNDQNYFFRVRTVKMDGKIISALYGKIHGDIAVDAINSPTAVVVFT